MNDFFYFNQRERKGVLFFFSIISLAFILPFFYKSYHAEASITVQIESLDTLRVQQPVVAVVAVSPDSLFPFDPNQISKEDLIALGLTPRVAQTLINFRSKGGQFFRKEDLKKIYGIEPGWYEKIENYIRLTPPKYTSKPTSQTPRPANPHRTYTPRPPVLIEINTADAETWTQLRGIGPVLSERIVKFREKLGGFYSIEQVNETFGLPDSTFQAIRPQLKLEASPQKLYINQLATEQLANHPYIDWKLARILVNYRTVHGPFQGIPDLEKVYTLEETTLNQLQPYLSFCTDCSENEEVVDNKN